MIGSIAVALAIGFQGPYQSATSPNLLIVQLEPERAEYDPKLILAPYIAEELDKEGRVAPVIWSELDPTFREWVDRKEFGEYSPRPTLKMALDKAKRLRIPYLLAIQNYKKDTEFVGIGELYQNGSLKWRFGPRNPNKSSDIVVSTDGKYDDKATRDLQSRLGKIIAGGGTFTVMTGGLPDWDGTARALASTWNALLGEGPLKALPAKPRIENSNTTTNNALTNTDSRPEAKADNVVEIANQLVLQGKTFRALSLLREACDLRPFEVRIRKALADLLIQSGMPTEAGSIALAAAKIQPSDPSLWLTVATARVADRNPDGALEALKEAQSRGADGPTANRLAADIALLKGDFSKAVEHYQKCELNDTAYRLAFAMAMCGQNQAESQLIESIKEKPIDPNDYVVLISFFDQWIDSLAKTAANIVPLIRIHPGEDATLKSSEDSNNKVDGLRKLIVAIKPPKVHQDSHEARTLAYILLSQSTLEALNFAKTNDPDIGEEAVVTLGQATKLLPSVQNKFRLEQKYGVQ